MVMENGWLIMSSIPRQPMSIGWQDSIGFNGRNISTCAIGISSHRDTRHTKDRKEEKSHSLCDLCGFV